MDIQMAIPVLTPSLNKTLRMHWSTRKALKVRWRDMLDLLVYDNTWKYKDEMAIEIPYRTVTIQRYSLKALDYDNFVGGCKEVVVDSLVNLGLLEDDTPEAVSITYLQTKVDKIIDKKTVITLHSA